MTDETKKVVGEFLDKFWGTEEGKVYVATMDKGRDFTQFMPIWPRDRAAVIRAALLAASQEKDFFFCPSVFMKDAPRPLRDYVKSVNSHWVDFDGNAPEDWETVAKERGVPEPSLIVQSSVKGHQHAYWFIPRQEGDALDTTETITRNITAAFSADSSGWDLPQLLRIPGTLNFGWHPTRDGKPAEHKSWYKGAPVTPTIVKDTPATFSENEFSTLTSAERQILNRIAIGQVPDIKTVLAYGRWSEDMYTLFNMTEQEASDASPNHRSGSLQRLAYYAAEQGFSDDQIYSILDDADTRWQKYTKRSTAGRDKILRDTIARARTKIGYLTGEALNLGGLLAPDKEPAEQPKFVFNYGEFLSADFKVDWVIDNLLAVGGFGLLVGQPGVGKTRLGIQMGLDMAIGRDRTLMYENKSGPKRVCLLSLEMAANPLALFMQSFNDYYDEHSVLLSKNFLIVPTGQGIAMDRPEGQQVVKNILSTIKPDILIVDSLQKSVSKPMTDELAMKDFNSFLSGVRAEFNMSTIFVHHNRKRSNDGYVSSGDLSDVYGSQVIAADVDFVVSLSKAGTYVKLDEYKNRLSKHGELHDINLISDGIRFILQDDQLGGILDNGSDGPGVPDHLTF